MNRQDAKIKRQEPETALDELAYQVIGAGIEVHRELGPGFLESVYEEAMAIELALRGIRFERQKEIHLGYKGHNLTKKHRLDFLINNQLVVELKAVTELEPIHEAIVHSYLKATNQMLGLLMNFNTLILKDGIRRIIRS